MIIGRGKIYLTELEAMEAYSIINLRLYWISVMDNYKIVKLILNVSSVRVTTLLNICLNAPYTGD